MSPWASCVPFRGSVGASSLLSLGSDRTPSFRLGTTEEKETFLLQRAFRRVHHAVGA